MLVDMAKLVIDHFKDQIDINSVDPRGRTVLHLTVKKNYQMVQLLVFNFKNQIKINLQDCLGNTVLHLACRKYSKKTWIHGDIVRLLLYNFKHSINVMILGKYLRPAFYHFFIYKDDKYKDKFEELFLPLLIKRDKSKDPYGLTPLQFAYLFKNQQNYPNEENGTCILNYLCHNLPVQELEGLQRDKFQTELFVNRFKATIDVMSLDKHNRPGWYIALIRHGQTGFKNLFLPLLLSRDKSKDPHGLTPLHIAYLFRNQMYDITYGRDVSGEFVLNFLLTEIPELVELDQLQPDKFQTLPHQVTPLPFGYFDVHITYGGDDEFIYHDPDEPWNWD